MPAEDRKSGRAARDRQPTESPAPEPATRAGRPTRPAAPGHSPRPQPGEHQALGRAIKIAQYRHHRALESRLAALGTTLAQWDALRAMAREPGASAHALAVATFQSDQAFGTLANRLETLGQIERRPGHGRRIEHHLTAAGKATLAAGHPIADAILAASFAPLSKAEQATLLDLLGRVIAVDLDET